MYPRCPHLHLRWPQWGPCKTLVDYTAAWKGSDAKQKQQKTKSIPWFQNPQWCFEVGLVFPGFHGASEAPALAGTTSVTDSTSWVSGVGVGGGKWGLPANKDSWSKGYKECHPISARPSELVTWKGLVMMVVYYHWWELPQVSFLSFVATNTCFSWQNKSSVVTKACLTQRKFCRDKNILVSTNLLTWQIFVVTKIILSQNFCYNKLTFVATKSKEHTSELSHTCTHTHMHKQNCNKKKESTERRSSDCLTWISFSWEPPLFSGDSAGCPVPDGGGGRKFISVIGGPRSDDIIPKHKHTVVWPGQNSPGGAVSKKQM